MNAADPLGLLDHRLFLLIRRMDHPATLVEGPQAATSWLCYAKLGPSPDHPHRSRSSTLGLPAPQAEAHGEEEVVMVALTPGFEHHVPRSYVRGAAIVPKLVHQGVSILDPCCDPDLPLLECGHGGEDEILLRHRPVSVRPGWHLQRRVGSRDGDGPEVHPR